MLIVALRVFEEVLLKGLVLHGEGSGEGRGERYARNGTGGGTVLGILQSAGVCGRRSRLYPCCVRCKAFNIIVCSLGAPQVAPMEAISVPDWTRQCSAVEADARCAPAGGSRGYMGAPICLKRLERSVDPVQSPFGAQVGANGHMWLPYSLEGLVLRATARRRWLRRLSWQSFGSDRGI